MHFETAEALWLIERHRLAIDHLKESLLRECTPAGGIDILLTGFRSFTQDASGRPEVNPTSIIMRAATDKYLARPDDWLPEVGTGRVGRFRCVTLVANTDYNSPAIFIEACHIVQPRIVLATGLGERTVVETGAINRIRTGRPVYDHAGTPMTSPAPTDGLLSHDLPGDAKLPLPWGGALAGIKDTITKRWRHPGCPLGEVGVAAIAREGNDYICNATAWLLARLVEGNRPIQWIQSEDGNENASLSLGPICGRPRIAGFVHFSPLRMPREGYEHHALTLLADLACHCT